ncbi:MAG: calcium/proton exchanger [Cyanobacteriota bacterium ELA615]
MYILFSVVLLLFVPLSVAADILKWNSELIFISSAVAIIPLSLWLSTAIEKIAVVTGPSIGGLINAIFGNATLLIISLIALKEGLIDLVKASITGSILCDLLLYMGLGMLAGGIRYKQQNFQSILAQVNGSSMTLAVLAVALPTLVIDTSKVVDPSIIKNLSISVAAILLIVYGLTLLFSLKTHSFLYEVAMVNKEEDQEQINLTIWIGVLLISTLLVAYESDIFVGQIENVTQGYGLTPLFTGVVLLPLISDMAGIVTVIRLSLKNNMDLTVATAMGDSLLVSLFVAPLLVLLGQLIGQTNMDLDFNPFQVVSLAISLAVCNLISFSGQSNWLDGILLLATYLIFALGFFYHPA